MKKYPKYKPCGDWIREIPSEWVAIKYKFLANIETGSTPPKADNSNYEGGDILFVKPDELNGFIPIIDSKEKITKKALENSRLIKEFSLLTCAIGTIGKFGIAGINCITNQQINSFTFNPKKINPKFGIYSFIASEDEQWKNSTTNVVAIINKTSQSRIFIPYPSLTEQHAIVRFLDYKTGQIDRFIANRQKQIELLKEQKAGIINKAVTKGINPNAKMKDSGIEWIGEVPEHWEILKLKYIIKTMASGVSVNSTDDPAEPFEFGILKTSCVYTGEFNPNENKKILESEFDRMACQVKGNSIIMSRMNTPELVGANGFVDKDYKNLFLPDRLWQTVFFKKAQIVPRWLSYFLASHRFRTLISSLATGTSASMKNITQEDVLGSSICLPTIKEQNEMLVFFENETSIIDTLISKYQKQIDLMQEYRTSLISQAVTGKIDVREWHPKKAVTA